jgi:hypothetical protein
MSLQTDDSNADPGTERGIGYPPLGDSGVMASARRGATEYDGIEYAALPVIPEHAVTQAFSRRDNATSVLYSQLAATRPGLTRKRGAKKPGVPLYLSRGIRHCF